jgi:hypothetical protein
LRNEASVPWSGAAGAEKGVRKEDHVVPWQRRMASTDIYGVYFIFKSIEQGATFRVTVPKYATKDPNYRILARQRSRFTHYYFYIRDKTLGPMVMRVASFFPFQTTYYLRNPAMPPRPERGRPRLSSQWTRRWREMDSNPRSPGHGELRCRPCRTVGCEG